MRPNKNGLSYARVNDYYVLYFDNTPVHYFDEVDAPVLASLSADLTELHSEKTRRIFQ